MNAIFIHIPMGFSADSWEHNYINIMPMGVFSVANYANRNGHHAKVMNAAVYKSRQNALEVMFSRIAAQSCDVVAFTLHWHFSAFDVLFAVNEVKKAFPAVKTLIGGFTASIYPTEFLNICPALDGVVQGEGEVPFSSYLEALSRGTNLAAVPNLHWRDARSGAIISNDVSFVADRAELSSFDFGLDALWDTREYVNGAAMFEAITGKNEKTTSETIEEKWFFLNIGRGCNLNCIYCAGSQVSFQKHFSRPGIAVRSIDSVLKTVRDAHALGFRTFHIAFDPPFANNHDEYFPTLFRRIHAEVADDLALVFEPYCLPSRAFVETCSQCFKEVVIALSPCFYEFDNMKKYKGYHYTEEAMKRTISDINTYPNCKVFVFYTVTGIDRWDEESLCRNVETMTSLQRDYRCQVMAFPMIAEPGSPWVSFPEVFKDHGIELDFDAFWLEWQKPLTEWNRNLVYNLDSVNELYDNINHRMDNEVFHKARGSSQDGE